MKNIAIYTRKSVYVENSESIETQINMCKAYFTRQFKGCEFEIFEDEGFSGKNTDRPAFKRLMNLCKLNKFDAVAVYKIDRLARNVVDFMNIYNELEKLEIKLISITEGFDPTTPIGKMMMVMLAGFADMERMNIAQRVKDNMISLAKKGCYTGGGVSRGYTVEKKSDGKKYLKLENEKFIKYSYETFLKGYSLNQLAKMQKEEFGSYALSSALAIRRMLRNPVYVQSSTIVSDYLKTKEYEIVGKEDEQHGYSSYNSHNDSKYAIVSKHIAVIDSNTWLKVNYKLDKMKENSVTKKSKCYWLTGVLKCPYCNANYILANANGNTYYTCSTRLKRGANSPGACSNKKYINAIEIETLVEDTIKQLFERNYFNKFYCKTERAYQDNTPELENKLKKNIKAIKNLVEKISFMSKASSKYIIDKIEELENENSNLRIKIEENKLNLLEMKMNESTPDIIYNNIFAFTQCKTLEEKRMRLKLIFESLYYDPKLKKLEIKFI